MDETHDPLQCVKQLRQTLAADKLSIGFLLGAGCPCAIRVPRSGEDGDDPLIPDINGLTRIVEKEIPSSGQHKASFERLMKVLAEDGFADPNVENVLSCIRTLRDAAGKSEVRGLSVEDLDDLDKEVCRVISATATRDLPGEATPYHSMARFAGNYHIPPSEIFTTNYDLLMEQALETLRVPFFDGFVGSSRPFFDQRAIEDDALPDRWSLLWKLHGSINWRFNTKTRAITRSRDDADGEEMLIHPSHRKYDESRRMPYLVMIDRLKGFLRRGGKPVALVAIGHRFSDEHLNATIIESLRANPSAACFALQYEDLSAYPLAANVAKHESNFSLLARDAGIIRRHEGKWVARAATELVALKGAFELVKAENAKKDPNPPRRSTDENADEPRPCRFRLGDFEAFGGFLNEFGPQPDAEGS